MSPTSGISTSNPTITNLPLSTSTGNLFLLRRFQTQCLHRYLWAKPHDRNGSGPTVVLSVEPPVALRSRTIP
jgi:hypothetical protein